MATSVAALKLAARRDVVRLLPNAEPSRKRTKSNLWVPKTTLRVQSGIGEISTKQSLAMAHR
jgi:hypothetical protein